MQNQHKYSGVATNAIFNASTKSVFKVFKKNNCHGSNEKRWSVLLDLPRDWTPMQSCFTGKKHMSDAFQLCRLDCLMSQHFKLFQFSTSCFFLFRRNHFISKSVVRFQMSPFALSRRYNPGRNYQKATELETMSYCMRLEGHSTLLKIRHHWLVCPFLEDFSWWM